ncbi:YhdP family protein [Aquicella lusitana]|uniref:Uncharacterized protein (TIGR02099 family) n=1 Tax=Aquicella lusitana TaxID=254246 RepID=A0A370GGD9_9COXI|nr:YhdP family protein [Aquicella lusitana]RDI42865.1 uncharacterized protein (TIGR02099 family) [Aquicella lusitana]VVC73108.1 hypothetical protein AQULUS_08390 [Aquicella lusitana]
MKAFLISSAKKIAYVLAVCIILAAILVSLARLYNPSLNERRPEFEKWASELLQNPVTIEKVAFAWQGYQPVVSLNKVTVLNKETREPILQIRNVNVFISIPRSLWQRKFVPATIMVAGSEVNVVETATGEYAIQGFPALGGFNNQPFQREARFADVIAWLSTQPRLILRDIDVRYTGFTGQKRFVTLYNLSLENKNAQHIVLGKAILHQEIPTEMSVVLKWFGNSTDLSKIRARIYLYISGLSLSQWLSGYTWQNWQVQQGIGSAKIWATWNQGTLQKIQTTFQLYDLILYSLTDKSKHLIKRISGNVGWKRDGQDHIFAGNDILIDLPGHFWPVTSFYVAMTPDASGTLLPTIANLGYVDLYDIQAFLYSSPPLLSDETRKLLSDLQLKGSLLNAAITFSGSLADLQHISLNANFSQLSFLPLQQTPGVHNLSGNIKWDGTQGDLSLSSHRVIIKYDTLFANPINVDQLTGNITWQPIIDQKPQPTPDVQQSQKPDETANAEADRSAGWMLRVQGLQILNSDAAANVNGSISLPANNGTWLADLSANFTVQKVRNISRYLPLRTFNPALVKWLQSAFLSGEVQSGNAVLKGPLNAFPFPNGEGTFLISGDVKNIDLFYAAGWPQLNRANGKLTFSGSGMQVDIAQAKIFDIPVKNVTGEIQNLADPQLKIQSSEITTDFAQGLKFINASPLKETIGRMFTGMSASGPVTLKLGLAIPLVDPAKAQVQGKVVMKNAQLELVPWRLKLDKLNGQFSFTENTTEAENIEGLLFNKPIRIDLKTIQKSANDSVVRASLSGDLYVSDLESWLKIPFSKVAEGNASVKTDIDFAANEPIEIHLRTNLVGITLDLPDQYGKKAQQERNLAADIEVRENQPLRIQLSYGDLLGAALILNRQQETFDLTAANLQLGTGTPDWPPGPGLYITGNFDQLDWDKIKGYMGQNGGVNIANLVLRKIDIRAKTLDLLGQRLTQVQLQVTPSQNNWIIDISSPEVAGEIVAPVNLTPQGSISAQFQKLNLQAATGTQTRPAIDVKSLPSISFTANNVSYNAIPFGQVAFKTAPSGSGMSIRTLRITSSRMDLQASGAWTQSNTTSLQGVIKSSNVSNLLNSLGFDVHNFVSSNGRLDFSLSWHDAPFAPSVASLSGNASLDMGKGRIVEVSQTSGAKMDLGRMLSIFSLQTIPRRLMFDFSDVFQKGYSFDYVRGDFRFDNGNAFTNNLRFEGPIAAVGIHGRIGLKNKDYDFTLSVTPHVTSSIPVAATLITGNPVVGLAAMAVNTVISSGVSKATSYYYAVTGSWDNPSWKSISVPARD